MNIETAKKINKAMVDYYAQHVVSGIIPTEPPPDYSLAEMLEAATIMKGHTETEEAPGTRNVSVTCSDNTIAAMYLLGYSEPADLDYLSFEVIIAGDGKALVCLKQKNITRLEDAWSEYVYYDQPDCDSCGKVDPAGAVCNNLLLREALDLLTQMPIAPEYAERMEELLEGVAANYSCFKWRKCGISYGATLDAIELDD